MGLRALINLTDVYPFDFSDNNIKPRNLIIIGTIDPGAKYTMADLRRIEADLKRKSDLLSEVKVLLAQAAERERSLIAEREDVKSKASNLYMLFIPQFYIIFHLEIIQLEF